MDHILKTLVNFIQKNLLEHENLNIKLVESEILNQGRVNVFGLQEYISYSRVANVSEFRKQ